MQNILKNRNLGRARLTPVPYLAPPVKGCEGWMVRYGRRKIGTSFIHTRYFILRSRVLSYHKMKPRDNEDPINSLVIDGNCLVEDKGWITHDGQMLYVLLVYNKKEMFNQITMAAYNIEDALFWKRRIEYVIDLFQESLIASGNKYFSLPEHESQFCAPEDEDDLNEGPKESEFDEPSKIDSDLANQDASNQSFSREHWRLLQCQNGLCIFEELLEGHFLPKSCSRALKAIGVVKATCGEIFELVMGMDARRFEWDCSFQYGSLVEEVDGHTAILYHRLQLDWFPVFVWPRDLCYVRYWRRNDDGSYVLLFRSREHENCGPQPGFVRGHIESGGFHIAPLKPRNGRPRTKVQQLIQIDLKGWGMGYISSFQQHCLLQILNSVAGLREYFSQKDEKDVYPRIPAMVNLASAFVSKKSQKLQEFVAGPSLDQINALNKNTVMMDEYSDDDDEL